ncbi:hypothetical protein CLORY_00510 [Clostridium oryzae]|uniref:Uncharacterized protein n=1 Tax=Clostridium oryzae TaxID=1450648 RepID=A0A1V4IYC7_9CLOT|nr:hypothetical protein CLORY_00510 [Clostridium oryzae]
MVKAIIAIAVIFTIILMLSLAKAAGKDKYKD